MSKLRLTLSVLLVLALLVWILSASIGLPIYIRPFYYAHIEALDLAEVSGYSEDQIKEAYDEVLDYLTLPGREFGTGEFPHSDSGRDHFVDCKFLFDLNAGLLLGSSLVILALWAWKRLGHTGPYILAGHSCGFWAGVLALVLPVVVGIYAALDFDRAFVLFHAIFFPGKSNWVFDWYADPIIRVLPQAFFRNCAIFIGAGILIFSLVLIFRDLTRPQKGASP